MHASTRLYKVELPLINYYSGTVSRNDANDGKKSLNLEDIYKNDENNFRNKLDKFKNIWNTTLSKHLKNL